MTVGAGKRIADIAARAVDRRDREGVAVLVGVVGEHAGAAGTGGTGVFSNDSDKDGDAFSITAVNGSGGNVGNSLAGTYGHLTLNANGSYSYTADNTAAIDAAPNGS